MTIQMSKAQFLGALAERIKVDRKAADGMLEALAGLNTETVSQAAP